jgi:hypothetical protein
MKTAGRLFAMMGLCLAALPAAEPGGMVKNKIVPPRPMKLSAEDQVKVVRQIVEAEPALKALLDRFPDATLNAGNAAGGRYAASASLKTGGYLVSMRVTAKLDETLAHPAEVRREMFTAMRETDVRNIKPGQVLPPVWLSFDRIEAFCADPAAVIAASPVRTGPNTFVYPKSGDAPPAGPARK